MRSGPRRIAYVTKSPFIGGAERSLLRFAADLTPQRYTAKMFACGPAELHRALDDAKLATQAVRFADPKRRWPWPYLADVARLAFHYRHSRIAIAHVNDTPGLPVGGLAATLAGIPTVAHVRYLYGAEGLRWQLRHGRGVQRLLFASQFMREQVCRRLDEPIDGRIDGRIDEAPCVVIPNGVALPPAMSTREARHKLGMADGEPVITFAGQVIPDKGVEDFLQMAARLRGRCRASRFLIVGEDHQSAGAYRAEMEGLARRTGIADVCRFLGFRDDVTQVLAASDLVVMPSRAEPFGNVAVEAGAAGRAIVATRVGGLPEIVRDGETGLLVEARNPGALADAAILLLRDGERLRKMGESARAHIGEHFSLKSQTDRLQDLYDDVLEAFPTHSSQ